MADLSHVERHFAWIIRLRREEAVRSGTVEPRTDAERRQAAGGPVHSWRELEAFADAS